ncbi:MAG: helix-turn-helix domain-containing protein, partial [Propionibacteriaceae bacterium]|nr:helix-turn-helix domain-containing protein [Propionibacteriaceae bacterium]
MREGDVASKDVISEIERAAVGTDSANARVGIVFLDDIDTALQLTVAELAAQAGVSQATVVRFCQSLGYSGLRHLRIDLAREASRRAVELESANIAEGRLNTSDSAATVIAKVAHHEATSIQRTAHEINPEDVDQVARAIAAAPRVISCG